MGFLVASGTRVLVALCFTALIAPLCASPIDGDSKADTEERKLGHLLKRLLDDKSKDNLQQAESSEEEEPDDGNEPAEYVSTAERDAIYDQEIGPAEEQFAERRQVANSTTTGTARGLQCTGVFKPIHDKCIYVGHDNDRYVEAMRDCRSKGGRLVTIEYARMNKAMISEIPHNGHKGFWINGITIDNGHRWIQYDTGENLRYHPWSYWQPDNWLGKEACAMVYFSSGRWNDQDCHDKLPYACEAT